RRAGVGALARAASHRRLERARVPTLRQRRMRRRQGERVPHPAPGGSGADGDRFAALEMIRVVLVVLASAAAAEATPLHVVDDRGVSLSLQRPAQRIVALAPHLAEITFAAGAGAKLVGVSSFSRHPAEAERLPVVASSGRVDIERLIVLK